MAFLHCHNCDWSQDDFYSKGYNPAKYLMGWNQYLFGDKKYRLDEQFSNDSNFIKENGDITTRAVLVMQYEKFAERIRTMKWVTWGEYKNEPNKICPQCGSHKLDID